MESTDLHLLLSGEHRLLGLETHDEPRALHLILDHLGTKPLPLWRWSVTEGLNPLGLSLMDTQDKPNTHSLEAALRHIKSLSANGLFVLCDTHPYLDDPIVIRLIKDLVFANHPAHKLLLLGPSLPLAPELARQALKLKMALPAETEILSMVRESALAWAKRRGAATTAPDALAINALVSSLKGLPHGDVQRLIKGAIDDDGVVTLSDLPALNRAKFELMNLSGVLHFEYHTAHLRDVAGFSLLKRWLNDRREPFLRAEKDIPKGVLLMGIQGGGKSLAAKAVAGVWGLPLLRLDMAQLYNKFIGETERNLREALQLADQLAPCVLWMDELEKGLADGSSDNGLGQRLLGSLLTWMSERKSRVFLVATSNEIRALPPELLRKGRFDEIFFVDLPAANQRLQIFTIHLQKREQPLDHLDLNRLAALSDGFTGAEIEQAIVSGLYNAQARNCSLDQALLEKALAQTCPLSVLMAEPLAALRAWAEGRALRVDPA
jgi:hypothetical protein